MDARPGWTAAPVRWGLPDVAIAWVVGIVAGIIVAAPFVNEAGKIPPAGIAASIYAQNVGIVVALSFIARMKGRGTLATDFGLSFDARRTWQYVGWVAAGVGVALAGNLLVLPLTELAALEDSAQDVVNQFEAASPAVKAILFPGVVLLAPLAEELLFRGALLRSLQRRTTTGKAVFASALIFAVIHLIDPDTYYYLPAFLLLGLVSGWRAAASGGLAESVCLHVGFNLVASVLIVTGGLALP
jgi:membrane protease YdiL (CAAX protease family)